MKTKSPLLAALVIAALIPFGSLGCSVAHAAGAIAVDDAVGNNLGFGTAVGEHRQTLAAKAALKAGKK